MFLRDEYANTLPRRIVLTGTTDASGDLVLESDQFSGTLHQITLPGVGSTNQFASGVGLAVTLKRSAESVLTKSSITGQLIARPMLAMHGTDGAVITGEVAPPLVVQDKVKVVVSAGGNAKTGTVELIIC